MPARSLHAIVGSIGLAVAVTIFVAPPAGYFLLGYANSSHELRFKSHLTADRLAKYIYRYRALWQYQAPRLSELIEMDPQDNKNFAQEVRDKTGKLVLRSGPSLKGPLMVRSYSITVSGTSVGRVDAMSSLWPLLEETGLRHAVRRLARLCRVLCGADISVARARPHARRPRRHQAQPGRAERASRRRAEQHGAGAVHVRPRSPVDRFQSAGRGDFRDSARSDFPRHADFQADGDGAGARPGSAGRRRSPTPTARRTLGWRGGHHSGRRAHHLDFASADGRRRLRRHLRGHHRAACRRGTHRAIWRATTR